MKFLDEFLDESLGESSCKEKLGWMVLGEFLRVWVNMNIDDFLESEGKQMESGKHVLVGSKDSEKNMCQLGL